MINVIPAPLSVKEKEGFVSCGNKLNVSGDFPEAAKFVASYLGNGNGGEGVQLV